MNRFATTGILVAATLLLHVSTASAQRWGRGATPRAGVCFYEDINFDGRYFCSPVGATTDSVPSGMNDRVSSVRVFGNAVVTVYRDPNLHGQSKFIDYDVADMRRMGFNDRVSSYIVDTGRGFAGARNGNNNGRFGDSNERSRRVETNRSRWNSREAEAIVRRSYQSVLGRAPDPEGLRSWTEQVMRNNWSERDLEAALRQSDEYRSLRDSNTAVPRRNR